MDSLVQQLLLTLVIINTEAVGTNSSSNSSTSDGNSDKNYPLYVVRKNGAYQFVDSITYDRVMKQRQFDQSDQKIFAACSKMDTDEALLEIQPENEKKLADGFVCKTPTKFFVKKRESSEHYLIGFMIYNEGGYSTQSYLLPDLLPTHLPLGLIRVAYRTILHNGITTWHDIKYANTLSLDDPSDEYSQNPDQYQKDIDIYGFDIDQAYELTTQKEIIKKALGWEPASKFVKLQLAPSGDFFFDAWKHASRTNINTTPVWQELVSEWHQLEKFIRRVAKFVGDLQIITGAANAHVISTIKNVPSMSLQVKESSLFLPVFKFIFKAVFFNQKRQNGQWLRQGIVFEMVNHPKVEVKGRDEYADKYGWKYLEDQTSMPKIFARQMDADTLEILQVYIGQVYTSFDLHKVKKLVKNASNEENIVEINVVEQMMKEANGMDLEESYNNMKIL